MASSAFDKLAAKLAQRKGVSDPRGLAAAIGRNKYGAKGMAAKAAAGRRKKRRKKIPPRHPMQAQQGQPPYFGGR